MDSPIAHKSRILPAILLNVLISSKNAREVQLEKVGYTELDCLVG